MRTEEFIELLMNLQEISKQEAVEWGIEIIRETPTLAQELA